MTRLTEFVTPFVFIGPIWLYLVLGFGPSIPTVWYNILLSLPMYLLITFGCYSLATVGFNVYSVGSDDEAAESLKQDISDAKLDLRKKGFRFE